MEVSVENHSLVIETKLPTEATKRYPELRMAKSYSVGRLSFTINFIE